MICCCLPCCILEQRRLVQLGRLRAVPSRTSPWRRVVTRCSSPVALHELHRAAQPDLQSRALRIKRWQTRCGLGKLNFPLCCVCSSNCSAKCCAGRGRGACGEQLPRACADDALRSAAVI